MYIHRNFTHPGGVSPMKQERMIDPNAGEGSGDAKVGRKKQSEIDYSKGEKKVEETASQVQDVANVAPIAGEIIDAKNTVKDLIAGDYFGAALNAAGFAIPFVPGSVIKKGVKAVMNYIRKTPGAEDAIKKGTKILDEGGSTGPKPKGGVDGDLTTTQPFPENVSQSSDELLASQQHNFEFGSMPKFNKLVDNVADYRAGGKISNPQNLADNMPFAERLEFIAKNGHKDDWLFRGGVTKKGNKYFDASGVEIPLDPNVDYIPPGLKR